MTREERDRAIAKLQDQVAGIWQQIAKLEQIGVSDKPKPRKRDIKGGFLIHRTMRRKFLKMLKKRTKKRRSAGGRAKKGV